MSSVTVVDHPAAGSLLVKLRDEMTHPSDFRVAAAHLGAVLAIEATRDVPTTVRTVKTPLGEASVSVPGVPLVAVPVLRAGLGLLPGVHSVLPDIPVGMVGLERHADTKEPREYYRKAPSLENAWVLLLEPMLATGGSASSAVAQMWREGAAGVTVLAVVGTQIAIDRIIDENPATNIVVAAIDPLLDENAYIVPGLGDFGDRVFGTPH